MQKELSDKKHSAKVAVYLGIEVAESISIDQHLYMGRFHIMLFLNRREMRNYHRDGEDPVQVIALSDSARNLLTGLLQMSEARGDAMSFDRDLRILLLHVWLQARREAARYSDIGEMGDCIRDAEKEFTLPKPIDLEYPESKGIYKRLLALDEGRDMWIALKELIIGVWNAGITFQQRVFAKI